MQVIPLYRYSRPDGGTTVSTVKPDSEYTELVRLVADDGMALTDGNSITVCVDTENVEAWTEIVDPENRYYDPDDATDADYQRALRDMGVQL